MAETTFHSITLPGQNTARVPLTAVEFSTSTAYNIRDYCTYQGKLYKCTTTHAAGAWNASHFTEVNIGDQINTRLVVPSTTEPPLADRRVGDLWVDTSTSTPVVNVDPAPIPGSLNLPQSGGTYNLIKTEVSDKVKKALLTGAFSTASSYSVNDLCIYNDKLYRCITDIPSPAAWNINEWQETTIAEELKRIESVDIDLDMIAETFGTSSFYNVGDYVIHIENGEHKLYRCKNIVDDTRVWNILYWDEVKLSNEVSNLKSAFEDNLDEGQAIIQRSYLGNCFVANGLDIKERGLTIELNGTASQDTILFLNKNNSEIKYGNGMNSYFFDIYNKRNIIDIIPGHTYRVYFKLISGTLSRNNITYTSEQEFGSVNVARVWLMKSNATSTSDYYVNRFGDTLIINEAQIGTLGLYVFSDTIINHAIFKIYLEDVTLKNEEILEDVNNLKSAFENFLNEEQAIIQRSYLGNHFLANGLDIIERGLTIELNGAVSQDTVLFLNKNDSEMKYGNGFNSNFFNIYNQRNTINIIPGHTYRVYFKLISGTLSKNSIIYTSEQDFGSVNVVRVWLMKSNATSTSDYYVNRFGDTLIINEDQIGTLGVYIYPNVTADHAIFNVYLEDLTLKNEENTDLIPDYWQEEVANGIVRANQSIYESSRGSSILFITDCHWRHNAKKSPAIAKEILNKCNINWFINGGDILEAHTSSKETAEAEIQDCINAFYGSRLPMFTVYGNHDRNRNSNASYPERFLNFNEHYMLTNKSFNPNPYITYVPDKASYYWEDENYRYIALYWYLSDNRPMTYIEELMNTDKQIIIICHGIYFVISEDPAEDVIDNGWILYNLEPYKNKIRCIIQGHTHYDGLRYAWDTVPIVILTCDRYIDDSKLGTNEEQALSVITIDNNQIKVTRIGRGDDFTIEEGTPIFRRPLI